MSYGYAKIFLVHLASIHYFMWCFCKSIAGKGHKLSEPIRANDNSLALIVNSVCTQHVLL